MDQTDFPWRPLGLLLVEEGLLSAAELEHALEDQRRTGRLLGQILVARYRVTAVALVRALARQHGVELGQEPAATSVPVGSRAGQDRWRPLGSVLVRQGSLTEASLREALIRQREQPGRRLGEVLVGSGYISRAALAEALAEQHGLLLDGEHQADADVEALVVSASPGEPTYQVWEVAYEPADVRRRLRFEGPNFLEAADFASECVDREEPDALEIQRRQAEAGETIWTYSHQRAAALSSSQERLVETFGFDPVRWDARP